MNIKDAAALSGVSADNIRFYEKQGLLAPTRNKANGYREYTDEQIRTLKLIRALRMLDLPLSRVKEVLSGELSLPEAAREQRRRLVEQSQQLSAAIQLCDELSKIPATPLTDADALLERMDAPQNTGGFFRNWLEDFRQVANCEVEKRFTFVPDEPVTTPAELSAALFAYAEEQDLLLVITQESMTPEFTVNGIPYTASVSRRRWGPHTLFPVYCVDCAALHPEDLEAVSVPSPRRSLQKFLVRWGPALLLFLLVLVSTFRSLNTWESWVVLIAVSVSFLVMSHYADTKFNVKPPDKNK